MSLQTAKTMQLIDRYILKLFFTYLLAGVVVFVTLYLTVDAMSFALRFAGAGTGSLLRYYAYHTPWIVYQMLPVACLLGTLFTLATLSRSNELTALFSMGHSLWRVATPIMLAVAVVSVLGFAFGDQVLPKLIQKRNYVEYVEIRKRPGLYSTVKTNKIWYRSENVIFNIKSLMPEVSRAQGITLYYFDPNWNLTQLIAADEVEMKGNQWNLKKGLVTLFASESSFPLTKTFLDKTIIMNEDLGDIQTTSNSSNIMSVKELRHFIERNKEAGLTTLRYEVDYHAKFGFAFAAFVMSLVGVPFTVARARSGGMFLNFGVCMGVAFGYWITYSSGVILGQHAYLPPVVAAWGPNALTSLVAFVLIRRLKR
jgi:lipopolysaccharide export system permease protein